MSFTSINAPSDLPKAASANDLEAGLKSAVDHTKNALKLSKYYKKYQKICAYMRDLADEDLRSIAIVELTYDVAVSRISDILGSAAAPYLAIFKPYMKIAFSVIKINQIIFNANEFLDKARKISDREVPAILQGLDRFDPKGAAFAAMEEAGNAYLIGLWLSRDMLSQESIQRYPKDAMNAVFTLRSASGKLDASREPIDELLALLAHTAQIRAKIVSHYKAFDKRVRRLENARGVVPSSFGKIIRAANEIDQMHRSFEPTRLSTRTLTRPIDDVTVKIQALLKDWLDLDEKIERGILDQVRPR